mmetsp:Transcript_84180/g.234727  ORF Transcript_84180/g.234727 Transcript_84180/m.234727 type:complete len:231 (-) Transcript_84180:839-1531(-)
MRERPQFFPRLDVLRNLDPLHRHSHGALDPAHNARKHLLHRRAHVFEFHHLEVPIKLGRRALAVAELGAHRREDPPHGVLGSRLQLSFSCARERALQLRGEGVVEPRAWTPITPVEIRGSRIFGHRKIVEHPAVEFQFRRGLEGHDAERVPGRPVLRQPLFGRPARVQGLVQQGLFDEAEPLHPERHAEVAAPWVIVRVAQEGTTHACKTQDRHALALRSLEHGHEALVG